MSLEETIWFQQLHSHDYIMIFGAKEEARFTYRVLDCFYQIKADCYVVSERRDNPVCIDGSPVKIFGEISDDLKQNGLIIISHNYDRNENIKKILEQAGFKNIIASVTQANNGMSDELMRYRQSVLGKMQYLEESYDIAENNDYRETDIRIYAVTSHANQHQSKASHESKYIQYIQAGAKLTDRRVCSITDDTGENMSEQNSYYCELTALYWIYKNDYAHEYIGLYHYSRGLDITDKQLESLTRAGIDVVLPIPFVCRYEMVAWDPRAANLILKAIGRTSLQYMTSAEVFFEKKLLFAGNILLARGPIFVQWAAWMFSVLQEIEKVMKEENIPMVPRGGGYLGEILTSIFFLHHIYEYNVRYAKGRTLI